MKIITYNLCLLGLFCFAGCATRGPVVVDQPVGPDLAHPRVQLNKGLGKLMVYSACEVEDPSSSRFPTHSPYRIYDNNEKFLRRVDNRSGSFYQDPAVVLLPEGTYKIKARATNYGVVTVS